MNVEKLLAHGNIRVTIKDDHLDVVSEPPSPPVNTEGFKKIWVLADVYVFEKDKDHKIVDHQIGAFPNGIELEVPLPAAVLNDAFVIKNGKKVLRLVYFNKHSQKWVIFKNQKIDLEGNRATVLLKRWIKDPPVGWGGIDIT